MWRIFVQTESSAGVQQVVVPVKVVRGVVGVTGAYAARCGMHAVFAFSDELKRKIQYVFLFLTINILQSTRDVDAVIKVTFRLG